MSDDEIRKHIRTLLKAHPLQALPGAASPPAPPETFTKAGILPYLPGVAMENWQFLLMQPVATQAALGTPKFQMAKGTRMQGINGLWQDIRGTFTGEPEALVETALREGVEELAIDINGIMQLFDAGPASFTSVKTGETKWMWLFAAEMSNAEGLLPESAMAQTTAKRRWLGPEALQREARGDHASIIHTLAKRLLEC